jgi:D-lactate dehydrogenase
LPDASYRLGGCFGVALKELNALIMKVVAYSIKPFKKEYLALANNKKHDLTFISNPLNLETAVFAKGKKAVVVFTNDDVSAPVIESGY